MNNTTNKETKEIKMNKKINKKFIDDLRKNSTKLVYEFADFSKINENHFKELRESLGLTQVVFAEILGVSKKTIKKWEPGKNPIKGTASRLVYLIRNDNSLIEKIYKTQIISSNDFNNNNNTAGLYRCPECGSPLIKRGGCTQCLNPSCIYEGCGI